MTNRREITVPSAQVDPISHLLQRAQVIAVVGLSNSPLRPSPGVSVYMQAHGYRIIPVNPRSDAPGGEKSHPPLLVVELRKDRVNRFRRREVVEGVVEESIQL